MWRQARSRLEASTPIVSAVGGATRRLKVKLLAVVGRGGKVKIRFEDGPFPGLEEYAASRQLIARWSELRPYLRDEELRKSSRTTSVSLALITRLLRLPRPC